MASERWLDSRCSEAGSCQLVPAVAKTTVIKPPILHPFALALSPTSISARDESTAQIACFPGAGCLELETFTLGCNYMSDLPRHSICTERRKGADELEGACFNGWKSPVSTGKLAYRKRVAKLIFGDCDITGGRSWAAFAR
jgi:hypothetical protein